MRKDLRVTSTVQRFCVDSGSNADDPEKEAKTLKFPTIRVAILTVYDLAQFAQNILKDEELIISLNLVRTLLKEKRSQRLKQKNSED